MPVWRALDLLKLHTNLYFAEAFDGVNRIVKGTYSLLVRSEKDAKEVRRLLEEVSAAGATGVSTGICWIGQL